MKLINNKETLKLELHFDKSEYMEMSQADKSKLKSGYQWSRYAGAWVSRAKYPNHYRAERIAKELGAGEVEIVGEIKPMAERLEVAAEKAENRAERYEEYAGNAQGRAKVLQSSFNECRKDWSWLTQPNINSSRGRAFTNYRNKVIARYEKGFEEYKKSDYYQNRAATARKTAGQAKLKNPGFLERRIKEQTSKLKKLQKYIADCENNLYKVQQGETIKTWNDETLDEKHFENAIERYLERYDFEYDKQEFYTNCLDDIGGLKFNKDNLKVGYIIDVDGWGVSKVLKLNPTTLIIKTQRGSHLQIKYGEVFKLVEATEEKPKTENHTFKADTVFVARGYGGQGKPYAAYQAVKTTPKTVSLQEIELKDGLPLKGTFKSEIVKQRKPIKRLGGDKWELYHDDRYLQVYC